MRALLSLGAETSLPEWDGNEVATNESCRLRETQLTCRAVCDVLRCLTMRSSTITIRLDEKLDRELTRACAQTGRTRRDLARDALRRQVALLRFERLRAKVLPLAEARGYLTDDDVFRELS